MSIITDLGAAIYPTPETNEPPHVFRWRQTVALCLVLLGGFQMVQSSLVWGLVPFIFSGFASASQSQIQQEQLKDIRIGQIERNIRDSVELRCYAQIQGNMPVLIYATEAIRKYQADYVKLTQRMAQEPPCDALIITKR